MNELTRTASERQYEHVGNIRHGVQTAPWRVEFPAMVSTKDATDIANAKKIYQGSVVSLDQYGKYVLGCAAGTGANQPVPCISLKNVFDPDVTTGLVGKDMSVSYYSGVGGSITAVPVTCGYELETTEFDDTATYVPGDVVVAGTSTALGKVVKGTSAPGGAEVTLGYVSLAPATDYLENKRLAFFAAFVPAGISGVSGATIEVTGTGTTVTWSAADGKLIATLS